SGRAAAPTAHRGGASDRARRVHQSAAGARGPGSCPAVSRTSAGGRPADARPGVHVVLGCRAAPTPARGQVAGGDLRDVRRPARPAPGDVVSVARRAPRGAVRVAGQRATPPAFTLVQLARHAQLVQALVAADAAAMVPRSQGRRALITPEQLVAEY